MYSFIQSMVFLEHLLCSYVVMDCEALRSWAFRIQILTALCRVYVDAYVRVRACYNEGFHRATIRMMEEQLYIEH